MSARTLSEMDYADLAAFLETNGLHGLEPVLQELGNRVGGKARKLVSAISFVTSCGYPVGATFPKPEPKKRGRPRKVSMESVANVPDASPVVGLTPEITAAWSDVSAAKLAAFHTDAPITMDGRPLRFTPAELERRLKHGAKLCGGKRKRTVAAPDLPCSIINLADYFVPVPDGDTRPYDGRRYDGMLLWPAQKQEKPETPKPSDLERCADAFSGFHLASDESWIDHLRRAAGTWDVPLAQLTAELQRRWDASTAPVAIAA